MVSIRATPMIRGHAKRTFTKCSVQNHVHDKNSKPLIKYNTTTIPTEADLFSQQRQPLIKKTQVQVMGNPPNICKIKLPPSIPLYVKRNHLVSIFNSKNSNKISMDNEWIYPWKNLLLWQNSLPIYHKIISNSDILQPIDVLVSSNNNNCITALDLNGSSDWFIFGNFSKQIIAFENNSSLSIKPFHKFPFGTGVNNKKIKELSGKIFRKNIHISGRGVTVIQSNSGSSIYSIALKDSEDEILVKLDNLLGCSALNYDEMIKNLEPFHFESTAIPKEDTLGEIETIDQSDSGKTSTKWSLASFFKSKKQKIENKKVNPIVKINQAKPEAEKVNDYSIKEFIKISNTLIMSFVKNVKYYYHQFINGNISLSLTNWNSILSTKYVTIRGPRTVLIQSNSISSELVKQIMSPPSFTKGAVSNASTESFIKPSYLNRASSFLEPEAQELQQSINNKNHLKYAYVDIKNNKVVFEATPNFNQTLEEMDEKKLARQNK